MLSKGLSQNKTPCFKIFKVLLGRFFSGNLSRLTIGPFSSAGLALSEHISATTPQCIRKLTIKDPLEKEEVGAVSMLLVPNLC